MAEKKYPEIKVNLTRADIDRIWALTAASLTGLRPEPGKPYDIRARFEAIAVEYAKTVHATIGDEKSPVRVKAGAPNEFAVTFMGDQPLPVPFPQLPPKKEEPPPAQPEEPKAQEPGSQQPEQAASSEPAK